VGMVLEGVVTNVTNFGAFVDVGVHQDGLVHVSELSDKWVDDPRKVVKVGDKLRVRVLSVDLQRQRVALTAKQQRSNEAAAPEQSQQQGNPRQQGKPKQQGKPHQQDKPREGFANNPFAKLR
jgi:protein Tex